MYSDEFKEYVENNGQAYEKFIIKATDILMKKIVDVSQINAGKKAELIKKLKKCGLI